ncbi:MAG: glycoside hydrolase family 9 protein, partial [Ruminococcus sp.]|nr:glycoside hydrolase family 9 protein [Ruminococcus sp.]
MLVVRSVPSVVILSIPFDRGTNDWGTYKQSGGAATLTTEDGKLALKITNIGEVNYAVQVFYDIIPLYKNGVYRLKYDISCSIDRDIEGMIQQNGGTYQAYTWKGLSLTSTPQSIDYEFTMEYDSDIMSKLVFNCGTQGEDLPAHTIYIDNVSLELIDDSQVDYSSTLPYAPDININQIGYKSDSKKTAVIRDFTNETEFSVINADTKAVVYTGKLSNETQYSLAGEVNKIADFSEVKEAGKYYISCGELDDSYTFEISDDVYGNLLDDTVKMLYLQRCGTEVKDAEFGHVACHTSIATIYGTTEKIDVSGGWHDAGDYGRYVVPAAKTVADLLYAYAENPELFGDNLGIPESGNGIADILDETRYELEWMLKMQASSGGVYHKVSCATFPGYVMPQMEKDELLVTPVSTTATADFCASMALAYEFYKDIDKTFADKCLDAAEKAWAFLEANPNLIFKNPGDYIVTGEYGGNKDSDERYWAAVQMYRATGDTKYLTATDRNGTKTGLDWSTVGDYGNIAILTMDGVDKNSTYYNNAKSAVLKQADALVDVSNSSTYGVAIDVFNWGSNMTIANAGIITSLAYKITGDAKYLDAAEAQTNYLLGINPCGECFVTGYGTVSPEAPHHRPSMVVGKAMKGM